MSADDDYRWRSASPDYYPDLKKFQCADPVSPEAYRETYDRYAALDDEVGFIDLFRTKNGSIYWNYELEVQNFIQGVDYDLDFQHQWADICITKPHKVDELGKIFGFVYYALDFAEKPIENNVGYIGYIARASDAAGCKIGSMLLRHACAKIIGHCSVNSNDLLIVARINPENTNSQNLFFENGFVDYGVDPDATDYHKWVRLVTRAN